MIRKNTINCKLIDIKCSKKSAFDIFQKTMDDFREEKEVCPTCGCQGDCTKHATYDRYLIDFEEGKPQYHRITVTRVICPCGATHAILPDPIIPYDQYSLFYILVVLAVYSCHILTIEQICDIYGITPPMLYRWKKVYNEHRREWQGLLKSVTTDVSRSLLELIRKDPYSGFSVFFIQTTNYTLLQTHANPTNCQRNLQYSHVFDPYHTT